MEPVDMEDVDDDPSGLHVGLPVRHPKFGLGKVLSLSPKRNPTTAKVYFDRYGAKNLILKYARLEPG
jgi:DNA helicase-2/ATP-dependent DNA helicase PcrA